MTNLMTVTQVSRACGVSARMLRYYEKEGLLESCRREGYAYRMYDAQAVTRLVQILVLRRLRLPLREIAVILKDGDPARRQAVFQAHIAQLDQEAEALQAIRGILERLCERAGDPAFLTSPELMALTEVLAPAKTNLKEESDMTQLSQTDRMNEKLNVRIVHLPPFTVAGVHYVGHEPEAEVGRRSRRFVRESGLYETKPDARMFGFNHPNPGVLEEGIYGYESWITIPEDFPLPEGIERRHFPGGLFAVLTMRFPEFQYWGVLNQWVERSKEYEIEWRGDEGTMGGCLEEHLNWVRAAHLNLPWEESDGQIDLMFPVRRRTD